MERKFLSECQYSTNEIDFRMHFFQIASIVAIFLAGATVTTGLHHRGFINVAGRLRYAGLSPKEKQIIRFYVAIRRCQKYGRFC